MVFTANIQYLNKNGNVHYKHTAKLPNSNFIGEILFQNKHISTNEGLRTSDLKIVSAKPLKLVFPGFLA